MVSPRVNVVGGKLDKMMKEARGYMKSWEKRGYTTEVRGKEGEKEVRRNFNFLDGLKG